MPPSARRLLSVSTIATTVAVLLAAWAGHAELIAYAAPVMVLMLPLVGGRYFGEDRVARLAARGRGRRPRRRSAVVVPARGRVVGMVARGGRLIARSLAVRPPPALALS